MSFSCAHFMTKSIGDGHMLVMVTKISVEHEFLEVSLNLPPQTSNAMEWSRPCPIMLGKTPGNGQGLDHSIIYNHGTCNCRKN